MKRIFAILVVMTVIMIAACNPYGSEIPSRLVGNWINQQNGNWDYGFYEEFAIANNDFWKYSSVSKDEIVLNKESDNGVSISLKIKLLNDTTLTVNGIEYQKYDYSDFKYVDSEKRDEQIAKCAAYTFSKMLYFPDVKEDTTDFKPHEYYRGDSAVIIFYERNTAQGIESFGRRFRINTRYMDIEKLNGDGFIGNGAEPVDTVEHYGMRYVFKVPVEGVSIVHHGNLLENWGSPIYLPCIVEPNDTITVFLTRETFENPYPLRNEYYISGSNARFHREQKLFFNYLVSKGIKNFNDKLENSMSDMDYFDLRHDEFVRDTTLLNEFIAQCKMPLSKKFVRFNRLTLLYKFAAEVVGEPNAEEFIKQNINFNEEEMFVNRWAFTFAMKYIAVQDSKLNSNLGYLPATKENFEKHPDYIVACVNGARRLIDPKFAKDLGFSDDFIEMLRMQCLDIYRWEYGRYNYQYHYDFADYEKQHILSNLKNPDNIRTATEILNSSETLWRRCFDRFKGKVVLVDIWNTWCPPCRQAIKEMKLLHKDFEGKDVEFVFLTDNTSDTNEFPKIFEGDTTGYHWVYDTEYKEFLKKFNLDGVPSFILIGKDGTVADYHSGFRGNDYYKTKIEEELRK